MAESGKWLYSPVRTSTLSRIYRTRVVTRYPCIMIISHLDALNPAACHRPVPSCTIFFQLARSNLPEGRRRRASLASSFTGALQCNHRDDVTRKLLAIRFTSRLTREEVDSLEPDANRWELVSREKQWDVSHAAGMLGNSWRDFYCCSFVTAITRERTLWTLVRYGALYEFGWLYQRHFIRRKLWIERDWLKR